MWKGSLDNFLKGLELLRREITAIKIIIARNNNAP